MRSEAEPHLTEDALGAYLDGELDPGLSAKAADHLATCAQCRGQLEAIEALFRGIESLPDVPLARDLSESVVKAVSNQLRWSARLRTIAILELTTALILIAVTWISGGAIPIPLDLQELYLSVAQPAETFSRTVTEIGLSLWDQMVGSAFQLQAALLDLRLPDLQGPILWGAVAGALMLWFAGNGMLLRSRPAPKAKERG